MNAEIPQHMKPGRQMESKGWTLTFESGLWSWTSPRGVRYQGGAKAKMPPDDAIADAVEHGEIE